MATFGDNGWLAGGNSLGGQFSKGFGEWLNDFTGQSSSARTQYQNQLKLQQNAQEFNKHAHQYEVADLEAAGLNPVLSVNGGTSPAGIGTASTGQGSDPIGMIGGIVGMMNSSRQTKAMVKQADAEVIKSLADAKKAGADAKNIDAVLDYYGKWGVFPGAYETDTGGANILGIGGTRTTTRPVGLKQPPKPSNSARKEGQRYANAFAD